MFPLGTVLLYQPVMFKVKMMHNKSLLYLDACTRTSPDRMYNRFYSGQCRVESLAVAGVVSSL